MHGGMAVTMRRMAGLKPMSSMRSTSSSTRISTWLSLTSLRPRKSSRRPGVATMSRAPRRMLSSCGPSAKPPTTSAVGKLISCAQACCTCIASSRVGSRMSALATLVCDFCSCSMMGMRKLSVLPVPVCAVANTSRPSRAGGMAPTCTGVRVMKFALASRCLSVAEIGNAENSFKINPLLPVSCETWSAVHLRTASPVRRYKIKARLAAMRRHEDHRRLRPSGCRNSALMTALRSMRFVALQRGCWRLAKHRPYTAPCQGSACFLPSPRISVATTLKGLGGIRPGFLHADGRKGRRSRHAGSLACEARKADNQTI